MSLLSMRFLALTFSIVMLFGCATAHDDKMARLNNWQETAKPLRASGKLSPLDYDKQELDIVSTKPMNRSWTIWAQRLSSQIEIRTDYKNGKISADEAKARLRKAADVAIEKYEEDERMRDQQTSSSSTPIYVPPQPTTTNCVKIGNNMSCTSY